MTISLKNNLFELWKTNYLRRGIQSEFKPSFIPKQVERIFENAGKYFDVLTGFNFPKFDKTNAKEYLNSFDTVQKQSKKILYFMPILESKNVMNIKTRLNELNQIYQLCSNYSENVLNIRVGATDFCNLYGLRRNINQTIYDIRVSR